MRVQRDGFQIALFRIFYVFGFFLDDREIQIGLRTSRIHLDRHLRFRYGFGEIPLRGVRTRNDGLRLCVLRFTLQYDLGVIASVWNLAGCQQQISEIELSFEIVGINFDSLHQFLIRVQPVSLFQICLREFVMCFSVFGIDLDRILKLDGGFAVLGVLKIGFAPGEMFLF